MIEFYRNNFDFMDTYNKFIGIVDYLANNKNPLEIEKLDYFSSPSDPSEIIPLLQRLYRDHHAVSDAIAKQFNMVNFTNYKIENIKDLFFHNDYVIYNRVIFFKNPLSIEAQNIEKAIKDYDSSEILFDQIGIILEEQVREVKHKINNSVLSKKVDLKKLSLEKIFQDLVKNAIGQGAKKLKIFAEDNKVKAHVFVDNCYLKNKEIFLTNLNNFNDFKETLISLFNNNSLDWKYYSSFYKLIYNHESDGNTIYLDIHNLSENIRDTDELSLKDKDSQILLNSLKSPSGLIIISGNANSGKRELMYSLLKNIRQNRNGANIITFEKEIKNKIDEVIQIEKTVVDTEKVSSYSVIGIDNDTSVHHIKDLIDMASRGKLVIAVIESASIFNTLNFIYESTANKEYIIENLLSIIHVGLLNKICKSCSYETPFSKQKDAHYFVSLENSPKLTDLIKEENKEGCDDCNYGFLNRIQVCEIVENDEILRDLFIKNYNISNYKTEKRSKSWNSIFENSMKLLVDGDISLNSIIKSIGYYKK